MTSERPVVLCFSGHDPGGGAGLLADAQAIHALGGHALCVVTANTVQDTRDVRRVVPTAPILLGAQLEALLDDCEIAAIKVGLVGDAQQLPYIAQAVERTRAPLIVDPVLRAGGGSAMTTVDTVAALQAQLFPLAELLTPNAAEARRLAPKRRTLDECAGQLLEQGCANVLVTGGDEPGEPVVNTWFAPRAAPRRFEWPRLPGAFHGAGCTLASAIAALRARGLALADALAQGQQYTHAALAQAYAVGGGRRIPGRTRAWP